MEELTLLEAQKSWAYHKYWVMGHSQAHYNSLRALFKGNDWSSAKSLEFQTLLEEAGQLVPTAATRRTAFQHIWGYFKKKANDEEKETYKSLIHRDESHEAMTQFLIEMIDRYCPPYLLKSKFYEQGGF